MNNTTLRDSIFTDLDEYDQIVFFFDRVIEDLNKGINYESIQSKYGDQWLLMFAGSYIPWDNIFLSSFYDELKKFEAQNPKNNVTYYFWSKFDEIQNTIWTQSPIIAHIAFENCWVIGEQTKIFRESTYNLKEPYLGCFPIPDNYLSKNKAKHFTSVIENLVVI